MIITRIKQSCFKISTRGKIFVFDPFGIKESSEKADFIFISHPHFDHNNKDSISRIISKKTKLICPKSTSKITKTWNDKIEVVTMEPGQEISIDGIKIQAVPQYNINKLIKFHPKKAKWCGYIVEMGEEKIYHAGDTDLIPEMNDLRNQNIDVAFLPIGYFFTMNPPQAIEATRIIHPRIMIPMHNRTKDLEEFKEEFKSEISDVNIFTLESGESTNISTQIKK